MIIVELWKEKIEQISKHKKIYKDATKSEDYVTLMTMILLSLLIILFGILLLPLEIPAYLIYKIIR